MITFPNAKINIGLNILSQRADGFHNISSLFYPIPFEDILEIIPAEKFNFRSTGLMIPGNNDQNLIVKAYQQLQQVYDLPPVSIHLHKIIPMGAGLGGGSSDAAFTIKSLNKIFNIGITNDQMEEYAGQLGSDCPFFIRNRPVIAEGTGTIFKEVSIDLQGKYLALVCPEIHVNTAETYSHIHPAIPEKSVSEVISNIPLAQWKKYLINDFEEYVFLQYPAIRKIKDDLYKAGAQYASMTGSGSAVFGIFDEAPQKLTEKAIVLELK